jgi:exopolyphosphatase/guanosine-5'-triphosphate,3'-diphosphate pyrophosphatase
MAEPATTHRSLPAARTGQPVYAALDLGTNNCRLLLGTRSPRGFRVVESFSRTVRLGEGLHESGRLSEAAMKRALGALQVCASRLGRRDVRGLRAIATEACRRAENAAEFLDRVTRATGLELEVITSREEAELALESCSALLPADGRRSLLFDIGGGSTELVWVRTPGRTSSADVIGFTSLRVGVVNLAERFGEARFTPEGFEAMVSEVRGLLATFEDVHRIGQEIRQGGVSLLGTSGTVTTLAGVALGLDRYERPLIDGAVLSLQSAQDAVQALRDMGRDGLAAHPCVGPDRVEFVLPGCAVFAAIARTWPAPAVTVADRGLREGMLTRMLRDRQPARPRRA